jgi:hypothetical protein
VKVVYIAGPYTAPNAWAIEQNIRRAEEAGMYVAECGAMPIIPHANTRFFHGTKTAQFWYDGTLELLRRSDAILLVEDWERSKGAREEREEAERLGLKIFILDELVRNSDLESWCKG